MFRNRRRPAALVAAAAAVVGFVVALGPDTSALAAVPAGTTLRSSVHDDGSQSATGGGDSQVSGNGQYEVFDSTSALAPNWPDIGTCGCDARTPNDTVYVRDLVSGRTDIVSYGRTGQTGRVTAEPASDSSYFPNITADGRYVSFFTDATNIAAYDTSQIVVCDRGPPGPDGTYARAPNPGASTPAGRCVEISTDGGRTENYKPRISADGSRIVWGVTRAVGGGGPVRFMSGAAAAPALESFVETILIGHDAGGALVPPDPATTQTVPDTSTGFDTPGVDYLQPAVSADGRWIVAAATERATGIHGIVEADMAAAPPAVRRIDFAGEVKNNLGLDLPSWVGNDDYTMSHPSVSGDGSVVAYDNDVGPAYDQYPDVYVNTVDTVDFATAKDSPAAAAFVESGIANGTLDGAPGDGAWPVVSADGGYLAFVTDRAAMVPGVHDVTGPSSCLGVGIKPFVALAAPPGVSTGDRTRCQVVVRDLRSDLARRAAGAALLPAHLASPSSTTDCRAGAGEVCAGNDASTEPLSLSGDGARVGFDSRATDLVPGDTNAGDAQNGTDAFVRTWTPAATATVPPFGAVGLGRTEVRRLTVTSTGVGPFTPGAVTITGADAGVFTIVGTTCANSPPLHTGDTCSVDIAYAPTAVGPVSASVDVYPRGVTTRLATATLTATGVRAPPVTPPAGDTSRTSLTAGGGQASSGGNHSMVSGDGRWDVFVSSNDLAGRKNGGDTNVFVRDLADPQRTVQISNGAQVGTNPTAGSTPDGSAPLGDSDYPSISADGRFVAFTTAARNIAAAPAAFDEAQLVVVCDRDPSGARNADGTPRLDTLQPATLLPDYRCFSVTSSVAAAGNASSVPQSRPMLSADGTHLTWPETDFAGFESQGMGAIWVVTISAPHGALHAPTAAVRVAVDATATGLGAFGGASTDVGPIGPDLGTPSLSSDGSHVVFAARALNGTTAIVENAVPGAPQTSVRVDVTPDGGRYLGDDPDRQVNQPATSDSGTAVAFTYFAADDANVYVARLGATVTSTLESLDNDGNQGQGMSPALSGDGRYLAFVTDGLNMHDGADGPLGSCRDVQATNRTQCEVVAKDIVRHTGNHLVSVSTTNDCTATGSGTAESPTPTPVGAGAPVCPADGVSARPSVDRIGSEIGYDSRADDLVPGFDPTDHDTNHDTTTQALPAFDAFVHTWRPTLSGPVVDFGRVGVHQHRDAALTLTETGFGPLAPGDTPITGATGADFSVAHSTCAAAVLNDSQTCTLTVRFTPSTLGTRAGNLAVDTGANGYPRSDPLLVRTLTGVGIVAPRIPGLAATPDPLDFGTPLPQDPTAHPITVTNDGQGVLIITGVHVTDGTTPGSGGDYTVDIADCAGGVQPGRTCTVLVTFTGSAVGNRDAVLTISSNGAGATTSVALHAGIAPPTVVTNPAVIVVGRVMQVNGTGFAPDHDVSLTFDDTPGRITVHTDAAGSFVYAGMVLLPNGPIGPRTLHAATSPAITASVPVLVVVGTVQGPILVTRR